MTVILRMLTLARKPRYFASFSHDELDALLAILDIARTRMGPDHELFSEFELIESKLYGAFKENV